MSNRSLLKSIYIVLAVSLVLFSSLLYLQEAMGGGTVNVVGARIDSYSPSSKITVKTGESFKLEVWFTNTGTSSAYFYAGASIWDSAGGVSNNYLYLVAMLFYASKVGL